ncbi:MULTISPECIES: tRNA pseudouridine(13) synthase TruD [unclassified Marinimicrobium]|jgi:tRNA pseudouridine13 synthase|uniref:tRNA pseudouridine(13) synthase TruD n=1 Tax=unclassified Marinimicrobium TaxID=2632100 RepID=UPI00257E4A28|nr:MULTISPECIES: tRNA pseudouridine(13) synthase TruD [unclassified Marinimicrobium]
MTLEFDIRMPTAWGGPRVSAGFRVTPEDFQVDEILGFEPEGEGEHWLVQVRKRGDNTAWVAGQLARCAGVTSRDVGFCGLKDRHAVATQWFSIYQPKAVEPDWTALEQTGPTVLSCSRHSRKLRRGQHQANHFVIRLRAVQALEDGALERLEQTLVRVAEQGAPNYFGEQRFGRDAGNLHQAQRWLVEGERIKNRQQRGMVMSAARSWLFNQVLAERVREGTWLECLAGEPQDEPSGPLWGRGRLMSDAQTAQLESRVLAPWKGWCDGLEHVGLNQERRALALNPQGLAWHWEQGDMVLSFALPPGTFATALLAEVAQLDTTQMEAARGATVL